MALGPGGPGPRVGRPAGDFSLGGRAKRERPVDIRGGEKKMKKGQLDLRIGCRSRLSEGSAGRPLDSDVLPPRHRE
jgi:hypothetical protein